MQQPLISFIVPVYKSKETLDACVRSVLDSPYENTEIILFDNGSSDGSQALCNEYVKKFPERIRFFKFQINWHPSVARNIGVEQARGKFVHFLDSDDEVAGDLIPRIAEILEAEPELEVMFTNWIRILPDGRSVREVRFTQEGFVERDDFVKSIPTVLSESAWSYLMNREFLRNHSLFFPTCGFEGRRFVSSVLSYVKRVYCLPQHFYRYRQASPTSSVVESDRSRHYRSMDLYFQTLSATLELHSDWKDAIQYVLEMHLLFACPEDCVDIGHMQSEFPYIWSESGIPADVRADIGFANKYGVGHTFVHIFKQLKERLEYLSQDFKEKIYICPAGSISTRFAKTLRSIGVQNIVLLDKKPSSDNMSAKMAMDEGFCVEGYSALQEHKGNRICILSCGWPMVSVQLENQLMDLGLVRDETSIFLFRDKALERKAGD